MAVPATTIAISAMADWVIVSILAARGYHSAYVSRLLFALQAVSLVFICFRFKQIPPENTPFGE